MKKEYFVAFKVKGKNEILTFRKPYHRQKFIDYYLKCNKIPYLISDTGKFC